MSFVILVCLGSIALPIAAIVWFSLSLVQYRVAKKANKKFPGYYSKKQVKIFKIHLLVSSLLFSVIALIFVTVIIVFGMAIIFM